MRGTLTILLLTLLLITGCSSKRYFEPKEVAGAISFDGDLPAPIVDVLREGATLENGMFISEDGLEPHRLPKGYLFIKKSDGKYIAASKCGALDLLDTQSGERLYHKEFSMKSVVGANIQGSILALVFDDNSLMAIDTDSDRVIYQSDQKPAIAVDTKIANPYFLGRLIIFPTLDGKLIVVDPRNGRELRRLVAGSGKEFNNIIFLKVIDENLIAATPNRVIAVSPDYTSTLDLEISDLLYVGGRVYILTKDGRIVLTDGNLRVLKTRKYPFAHFTGAIYGEYIYIIEKEGYIIAVDRDLRASNIFEFPTSVTDYIFAAGDKVFYDDKYFQLNRLTK
ncbi:MAG: PQQ-binding-like beta-propeller repeat protein [Epsilonproteobacteria bacterium]|nr:hypothetical protein [Campylobacterota bacterium]NPA56624.1 PQQ-binding-like beta-propeller repeat protein [Campylobacterota bacterium]